METKIEKTTLRTNSTNGIQREIKIKGKKLGKVTNFKYLGAIVSDEVSKLEVLSRIAQMLFFNSAHNKSMQPLSCHSNQTEELIFTKSIKIDKIDTYLYKVSTHRAYGV